MMKEPQHRVGTGKAIQELVVELNLPYSSTMQDWPYEIADADEIDNYINHYRATTDFDKKFVLMEMIIQATNDQDDTVTFNKYWHVIKSILEEDFAIHEYTIYYWSCFEIENIENCWEITPNMRALWKSMVH